jgi:hypothetical protein
MRTSVEGYQLERHPDGYEWTVAISQPGFPAWTFEPQTVRAWSLPAALETAARLQVIAWFPPEDDA